MRFYCFAVLIGRALIAHDCHTLGNFYQFQAIGRGCGHIHALGCLFALRCLLTAVCLVGGLLAVLLLLFPLLALLLDLLGILSKLCKYICSKLQYFYVLITVITITGYCNTYGRELAGALLLNLCAATIYAINAPFAVVHVRLAKIHLFALRYHLGGFID